MRRFSTKQLIRLGQQEFYNEMKSHFIALGNGGYYTQKQKDYAFELIDQYGVRATARILKVPRRTLQRWCRENGVWVRCCPAWVYGWVERRRKRREFWERRGYY